MLGHTPNLPLFYSHLYVWQLGGLLVETDVYEQAQRYRKRVKLAMGNNTTHWITPEIVKEHQEFLVDMVAKGFTDYE